jgi:hypothetical protein
MSGLVNYSVPRKDVEELDFSRLDRNIAVFKECRKHARGRLLLTFAGFNDESAEIYETMEIRRYVEEMFKKHPYIFYFLTDIDKNNQIVMACLADIETVTLGEKRKSLNEILSSDSPRDKIGIRFGLSNEVAEVIAVQAMKYGVSVGDKEIEVKRFLDRLFDLSPKKKQDEVFLEFGKIREQFKEANKVLWTAFCNTYNKFNVDLNKISQFADMNQSYILNAIHGGWLSTPILVERETTSNVFIVNDKAHGAICKSCDFPVALVIKQDFETDLSIIENLQFIPSVEFYIQNKIFYFDEFYQNQIPLPIDPSKDKWYCPRCKKLHSFSRSEKSGLVYCQY